MINGIEKSFLHPDNVNEFREILSESQFKVFNKIKLDSEDKKVNFSDNVRLKRVSESLGNLNNSESKYFHVELSFIHQDCHEKLNNLAFRCYNTFLSLLEDGYFSERIIDFGIEIARLLEQLQNSKVKSG